MAGNRSFPQPVSAETGSNSSAEQPVQPLFSVVAGNPSEEEVAALLAAVLTVREQGKQKDHSATALWQRRLNRGQRLGARLRPGPGSWRRARPM